MLGDGVQKGRGAPANPDGRFEPHRGAAMLDDLDGADLSGEQTVRQTEVLRDTAKSIVVASDSPDLGKTFSINPYRGCEHGCIYCYARPTHEYFGLSAGLDFETKIFAKHDAADLLRARLLSKEWQPHPLMISGVTDCYQPTERTLQLTRACLEVLTDCRHPVVIITKNELVTRDIDLFQRLVEHRAIAVCVSVTTLDPQLSNRMEPRASAPARRLAAIRALAAAGIPVAVNVAPIIPGLTDHEIPAILAAAAEAGACAAHYTVVRLPHGVKDLFGDWLQAHYPLKAKHVVSRIRDLRDGALYDSDFASRMVGTGAFAAQLSQLMQVYKKKHGLDRGLPRLNSDAFTKVPLQTRATGQADLFG